MSFIEGQDGLAVDLWPRHLQFGSILGVATDAPDRAEYKSVSATYGGILAWGYVGPNPKAADRSRTHTLYYRLAPPEPKPRRQVVYPAAMRLQGFIEQRDTRPLGNWEGDLTAAASAIQSITLSSRGNAAAWNAQMAALTYARHVIFESLSSSSDEMKPRYGERLRLVRRVFSMVSADNATSAPSVLTHGDDPYGWTAGMENRWRVTNKMQCGQVITDGMGESRMEYCNPAQLQVGDFVDVCVSFDIVTRKRPGQARSIQVHLTIQHVILLKSADDVLEDMDTDTSDCEIEVVNPGLTFA